MKTLLIVDLMQAILIFIGSIGLFYTGKDATPKASKIIPVIPPKILKELKEEVSDVYKSGLDEMVGHRRDILEWTGHGAVLLVILALLIFGLIFGLRRKEGKLETTTTKPKTIRHLLDLSEDERWRYIEAKNNGDLEEQTKILEGCGCNEDAAKCSYCSDDCNCHEANNQMEIGCGCLPSNCSDDNCHEAENQMKMIKTERD